MVATSLSFASNSSRYRPVIALTALGWALVAFGLYFEAGWATWVWPWTDARMTYIFLASIAAAVAAPLAWIVIVDEPAALAGMAIDGMVIGSAMVAVLVGVGLTDNDRSMFVYALGMAAAVLASWYLFRTFQPWPVRDPSPQPRFLSWFFAVLVAVLIPVGFTLMVQTGGMFPWDLPGRTSSMIGGVFIGAASWFVYGLWRRTWVHTGGQLAGFLAYGLVLGIPYWRTMFDRESMSASGGYQSFPGQVVSGPAYDINETSLSFYTATITIASLVCAWYLFVNRTTRIYRR